LNSLFRPLAIARISPTGASQGHERSLLSAHHSLISGQASANPRDHRVQARELIVNGFACRDLSSGSISREDGEIGRREVPAKGFQ